MTSPPASDPTPAQPLRLHVGGRDVKAGWKILNIQAAPGVDYVGSCVDLSQFADASTDEVYASHVYEHLGYQTELPQALAHVRRVIKPTGRFMFSVPDLQILCKLFLEPKLEPQHRFHVMRMIFGGQVDPYDFHKVGLTWEIAIDFLARAGFTRAKRVASFGLFQDTSELRFLGVPISLNIEALP
jgi:predicted SAM-dependent methyltransferase